jgi:hypothetical protein
MGHQLGVLIPIFGIFFGGMIMLSRTAIGAAIARRIGGEVAGHDVEDRLLEMRHELDTVRQELAETQERLDFTERALTQVREAQRLPKGN